MTYCPECKADIPASDFIAHRTADHPPSPIVVSVTEGIPSGEAFADSKE